VQAKPSSRRHHESTDPRAQGISTNLIIIHDNSTENFALYDGDKRETTASVELRGDDEGEAGHCISG